MSDPSLDPAIEARYKELAGRLTTEAWDQLVSVTARRMLGRLAMAGVFDEADPAKIQQGFELLGQSLVDFTNVALTSIAQGEHEASR